MKTAIDLFSAKIIEKHKQRKKRFYPMKLVFYKPVSKIYSSYILNHYMHKAENFAFISKVLKKNFNLFNFEKRMSQNSIVQFLQKKFFQNAPLKNYQMNFEKIFAIHNTPESVQTNIQNFYQKSLPDFQKSYLSSAQVNEIHKLLLKNSNDENKKNIVYIQKFYKGSKKKYFSLEEYLSKKNINEMISKSILHNHFMYNNIHKTWEKTYLEQNINRSNNLYFTKELPQHMFTLHHYSGKNNHYTNRTSIYREQNIQNINNQHINKDILINRLHRDKRLKKPNENLITYLQPERMDTKVYYQKSKLYFYKEKEFETSIEQIKESIVALKENVDYTRLSTQFYQDFEEKMQIDKQRRGL